MSHKKKSIKFLTSMFIIGLSAYLLTSLFVDYFKFPFYIVGLIVTPYSLILRYLVSDKWVWKNENNK